MKSNHRTTRRGFLRWTAGLAGLGWLDHLTLHADELRRQQRSCILLWMAGGPSQFETFDPKPGAGQPASPGRRSTLPAAAAADARAGGAVRPGRRRPAGARSSNALSANVALGAQPANAQLQPRRRTDAGARRLRPVRIRARLS